VAHLDALPGVTVVPLFANPSSDGSGDSVVSCSALRALPALGSCAPGVPAASGSFNQLLTTDNPLFFNTNLPAVTRSSPPATESLSGLVTSALLVKTDGPDTLEKVRTYLTGYEARSSESSPSTAKRGAKLSGALGNIEPETFGEVTQVRTNDLTSIERVALAILALILVVAGCSLAVSVAAGVLDRKRPFTLLRLSGAPRKTLTKVALIEAMVPLVGATVIAGAVAIAVARPPLRALFSANLGPDQDFAAAAHPGIAYYLTVLVALGLSTVVVLAAMPLLNRITQPSNARFE
jgi:hypothetical protein